jgi:hypothetical protein
LKTGPDTDNNRKIPANSITMHRPAIFKKQEWDILIAEVLEAAAAVAVADQVLCLPFEVASGHSSR